MWPFSKPDPLIRGTVIEKQAYIPDPEGHVEEPREIRGTVIDQRVDLIAPPQWKLKIKGIRRSGKPGEGEVFVSELDYNNLSEGDTWICAK